jgi:signal recognition particle receptor subunit beta
LVTDSTLENVLQSKDILEFLKEHDSLSDVVVIANKQDLPGALQPSIVQRLLNMKTFGLVAIDPNDRLKALDIIQKSLERDVDLAQMEFEPIDFVP